MIKHIFIILSILIINLDVFSQEHYIGSTVGGITSSDYFSTFYQYGLRYEIKYLSEKSAIYLEEVIEYKDINESRNINYAKTNLGLDFNFGNKLHYIIGVGLTTKILLATKNYYNNPNKLVFGAKFNTGFDYMLSSNFLISILGQYHFDITPAASSLAKARTLST